MGLTIQVIEIMASLFTAGGVCLAAHQIVQANKQAITSFEDDMARQYRDIIQRISIDALLKEDLSGKVSKEDLNEIYNYIDLTNEQVFLRRQNRISQETWKNWCEGIESNMCLPAFEQGWTLIKERTPENFFGELRRLEESEYQGDPKEWEN